MSSGKQCPNCGADNDLLFTNCQFCKTSLPTIDVNSISNEDLLQNAAEWVAKMGMPFSVSGLNANQWTGKDIRHYQVNEIAGIALKYLTLLQIRSKNNTELLQTYQELKHLHNSKTSGFFTKIGGGNKMLGGLLLFFLVYLITSFAWCTNQCSSDSTYDTEIKRLKSLEQQVVEKTSNKEYDNALILLNGMEYSIHWSNSDSLEVNAWRRKKEGYLNTIRELRSKN